jgi:hypothetical protein
MSMTPRSVRDSSTSFYADFPFHSRIRLKYLNGQTGRKSLTHIFPSPAGDVPLPRITGSLPVFCMPQISFLVILKASRNKRGLLVRVWGRNNPIPELAEWSQFDVSSLSSILASPTSPRGGFFRLTHKHKISLGEIYVILNFGIQKILPALKNSEKNSKGPGPSSKAFETGWNS